MSAPPRHLSMIRSFHLADFFTLGNAACGVLAVFAVMGYVEARTPRHLLTAAALIPLALVLDVLDGRVARSRQRHSAMGRELELVQRHKAEEDLAVAAASILARDEFVKRLAGLDS